MNDLRFAVRQLAKTPGFTAIALLTLALGIGLNTSMFSVLNTIFLRTLPYAEPDRLVRVFRTHPRSQTLPHSPANFTDLRAQNQSFSHMAALEWSNYSLAEPGRIAERLRGMSVTADFFGALGIQPEIGRVFGADEDQPGRNRVVVLSHTCWQNRFASDPTIIGLDIRLDGENVTVIGVMPRDFDDRLLWGEIDAWRPMAFTPNTLQVRGGNWLSIVARLKSGVTLTAAQAEISSLAAQLAATYPNTNAQTGISLVSLLSSGQDATMRMLTWFTMGLAVCVLLIACANLANLQFARNATRAREHAVRVALGASRFQLIRHSLTESLLLAAIGGALGLFVALWSNAALGSRIDLNGRTGLEIPLDLRVLGFAFVVAALTGVAFGLLPAWLAARADVNEGLKQGSRGSTGSRTQHRIRHTLIVVEVALALILLSGAGFFLRGLERFSVRDLGWHTEQLLTASVTLPATKYSNDDAQRAFYDRLENRLAALPGVEHVALSRSLPFFSFNFSQRFLIEGQPDPKPGAEPQRDVNGVNLSFFNTLGLTLVEGRTFNSADLPASAPMRTIINESMAKQFWPGESAIGKRIAHPTERAWQEIIGVVRDIRFPTNVNEPNTRFQTYRLLAREPSRFIAVTLRSTLPPETLGEALRRAVTEIDPDLPVQDIRPAAQVIERGLANFNVVGAMLTGFAALGLLLAAVGIYGVIASFVVQRTHEIGIRLALGAQIRDVLRLVLAQGMKLALLGAALGLGGAYAVARLLTSIAPALPPPEAATAISVTAVLIAVALVACLLPARRATKVDPMIALRAE
jgi:putative ABC transport system permease protein